MSSALPGRPQSRRPPVVARLPSEPGVYRSRDAGGRVLYVGRPTALRSRVGSYWSELRGRRHQIRMVAQVARIEAVACGSVRAAAEAALSATPAGWAAFVTQNAELAATLTRVAALAG